MWIEDPNQFIADDEDEGNMRNLRVAVLKLISTLIEQYGDDAIQAIMLISEKFLLNLDEENSYGFLQNVLGKLSGNEFKSLQDFDAEKLLNFIKTSHFECDHIDNLWKKKETGLLLLGSFSEDIIALQARNSSKFDIGELLQNLIVDIDNENGNDTFVYLAYN